jgi:hypothetical protein
MWDDRAKTRPEDLPVNRKAASHKHAARVKARDSTWKLRWHDPRAQLYRHRQMWKTPKSLVRGISDATPWKRAAVRRSSSVLAKGGADNLNPRRLSQSIAFCVCLVFNN